MFSSDLIEIILNLIIHAASSPENNISTYLNKKNYYPMRYHANPTHTRFIIELKIRIFE